LCCVGDDDQSIYSWRGAEIGNILALREGFSGRHDRGLEQNYRSTSHILGAAGGMIAQNRGRLGKTLWTEASEGDKVVVRAVWDAEEEARWAGDEIEALQRKRHALSEIAILVRAGFQTREFEERFISLALPYRVIGGPRFLRAPGNPGRARLSSPGEPTGGRSRVRADLEYAAPRHRQRYLAGVAHRCA